MILVQNLPQLSNGNNSLIGIIFITCMYSMKTKKFVKILSPLSTIFFLFLAYSVPAQTLTKKDTANVHFLNSRKFFIYKVEKGETLFSISQKFKIPQEEIVQFNHEINNGLKAKIKLWIPAYSWLKKDSIEKAGIAIVEKKIEGFYSIVVITSFNLPKIYTASDTSETFVDEPINDETRQNLEFIEGIIRSAELFKSEGFKISLDILDSENDSVKLLRKLGKRKAYNLIITNENSNLLSSISAFSEKNHIQLLSCAMNSSELIKENKYAISLLPSSFKQCEIMGKFSTEYFTNTTLILLKSTSTKELERAESFKSGWLSIKSTPVKKIDYAKLGSIAFADSLVKGKNNILFISSSNEDMVSSILNSLKVKIPEFQVTVIGLPTWQHFETIEQSHLELCNVHVFNSGFIDYSNDNVFVFRKFFREKYYSEPTESAYIGYDAMLVAGKSLLKSGWKSFTEETISGIYSNYSFEKIITGNAYENSNIHVFQLAGDTTKDLSKNFKK